MLNVFAFCHYLLPLELDQFYSKLFCSEFGFTVTGKGNCSILNQWFIHLWKMMGSVCVAPESGSPGTANEAGGGRAGPSAVAQLCVGPLTWPCAPSLMSVLWVEQLSVSYCGVTAAMSCVQDGHLSTVLCWWYLCSCSDSICRTVLLFGGFLLLTEC